MLKPTPSRMIWALLTEFCLILIAARFSGATGEVCKETPTGQQCAPYNLASFILIQIREVLHSVEGVITALASVAVAWFTWTLWQSSEKMWVVTRIAADAAMLSARAAIGIELPIIRVNPHGLMHGASNDGTSQAEYCSVHFLTFSNLGRTEAFPVEIQLGWAIGECLPDNPTYLVTDSFLPNLILEPDPKITQRKFLAFNMPLKPGEWALICEGKLNVWFYCTFAYADFMQTRHDAGFCWRWQNVGAGMDWRIDATPSYNRKT